MFKLQASVSGSDIEANIKKGVEGREVGANIWPQVEKKEVSASSKSVSVAVSLV